MPTEGNVNIALGESGYETRITINGHEMCADEPASSGGGGKGPSPYDMVLAGLGSCKAITARMYAERKGWPLRGVSVNLSHKRVHAADCAECDEKEGRVEVIDVSIEFEGDLEEDQRKRLLEIADRCPVHRTLQQPVTIRSTLQKATAG